MTDTTYLYSTIQYAHDPSSGERLNAGVIVFAPATGYLRAAMAPTRGRLAEAFAHFDTKLYTTVRHQVERSVDALCQAPGDITLRFSLDDPAQGKARFADILHSIWSDNGLGYRFGDTGAGVSRAAELDVVVDRLLDRLVTSQSGSQDGRIRRSAEDVWRVFRGPLHDVGVTRMLAPKIIRGTGGFELSFDHALHNGRWHILEPLTMDYADRSGIRDAVLRWLGNGVALQEAEEDPILHFLVGRPSDPALLDDYRRATDTLRAKVPVSHEVHEEDKAEQFAEEMSALMR